MKILLVDDKAENIYLLEKFLQGNGYTTDSAANGVEALAKALKSPPDLVVSDILMPVMDGFTFCRAWRKDVKLQMIPFIFYTATYTDPKDEEFALNLGADRFVVKPQELNDLLKIIKDTYNTSRIKTAHPLPPTPATEEKIFLKEYNETLIRKLEKKMTQIEAAERELRDKNAALEKDIEKRKKVEEELRVALAKYKTLFDCFPLGITVADNMGNIVETNPTAEKLLGVNQDEQIRRGIGSSEWRIVRSDGTPMLPEEYASVQALKEKRKVENMEMGIVKPDNMITWISVTAAPLPLEEHGVVITYNEITERKRAEEKLQKSEKRLREAQEMAHLGFWSWNVKTGEVEWSEEVFKIFCLDPKTFTPQIDSILALSPWPEDHHRDQELIKKAIETHNPGSYEQKFLRPDQSIGHYYSTFQGNYDEKGELTSIVGTVLDITERKRAEGALQESELRFRSLYENTAIGLYRTTPDGKILLANPALVKLLGYPSFEKLAERNLEKDGFETPSQRKEFLKKIERDGEIKSCESKWIRQDGTEIFVLESVRAIRDSYGKTLYYDGTVEDITERRQMEEGLRQMQKLEGLGTLAGGIAHDFNNILAIILAYITSTKRFQDNPKKLDLAVDTIVKAVERGKTLVQQVLTFARKTETEFGAVNVNDVVMEIMTMIFETFPKVLTYTQNFDKSIKFINADRSQLYQALLNLCVNARDAMPSGGVLTINTRMMSSISLRNQHPDAAASSYVCIEVSDTGEGMTEEIRKRIFEPFFTTKGIGKGTGLGLSVVFGIVQNHKGFVDVESEVGKGTTFRLYLPASQVAEPVSVKDEETLEEIPGGTETLLVVEDEEMLLLSLQLVLVEKGYKVISATDGLAAVNLFKERKKEIALVLTDLGLPNISGMEVCQRIKKIKPNEHIILATGFLAPEMKTEFLKAGIQHFLYKPYDLRKVLKMVRELLYKK